MSRWLEEEKLVKVYNWAYDVHRAARNGGHIAVLDLAVPDEQALAIDRALAEIADAALVILRALSGEMPGAQGAQRQE
jgi:hypothetical protein